MRKTPLDRSVARFVTHTDGWESLLTGLGRANKDKRVGARSVVNCMSFEELRDLYKSNPMAARICDKPAEEMTRKGWCVNVADDEGGEQGEAIDSALDDLKSKAKVKEALSKKRWSGGSAILIGVNDGKGIEALKLPVNESAIRSVDYLNVFDPREAMVTDYEPNLLAKGFKEPKIYRLNPRVLGFGSNLGVIDVHASRIMRFSGPVATTDDLIKNYGWGDSVLNRVWEVLRDYGISWSGAAALVQDFAQAVYKIRGLHDAVAADREGLVIKRLQLMDLSRSYLRGIALDADGNEEFDRKPTPIAGLPELLKGFNEQMASAANIPLTILFGQQSKGLGNGGEENTRNWYDQVAAMQEEELLEPLKMLVRYVMLAKQGPTKGAEPEDWSIKFPSLWQLSETELADVQSKHATADTAWVTSGVLHPEEIRKSRFEGDEYGHTIQVDKAEQAAFEATQPVEGDPATADLRKKGKAAEGEGPVDPTAPPAAPAQHMGPNGKPLPSILGAPASGAPKGGAGAESAQDTALNGAQVTSALEIVKAVAEEQLPRDSGVAMLIAFFNLAPEEAEKVMGTVGNGFKPKPPEPDVVHLGPDGKPSKPAPKPGEVPFKGGPK